jgi:predicted O-methyltransferase YrrM
MINTIDDVRNCHPELFAKLVEEIRDAGTDNLSHFGNGYRREGSYSLQQNPDEFAALTILLERCTSGRYLEIGSASGGAARWLHEHLEFSPMVSIDDGGHHRYQELPGNFKDLPMRHLRADSHSPEAVEWLRSLDGNFRADVVFIDGDHSEVGVWQDVVLCHPYWLEGSLVVLHDIVACEGVRKAWQRGAAERLWTPLAEYVGNERGLGIGVGMCL